MTTYLLKPKLTDRLQRSFEAYLTLYIALYQLYLETICKTNSAIESTLRDGTIFIAMNMYDCRTMKKEEIQIFIAID